MRKYRKNLSMNGFPLNVNLLFEVSFKVDPHHSGIATIKARLETGEPQVWADYGVTPPTLVSENDVEINTKDTHLKIRKFILSTEKNAQEEMDRLSDLVSVGSAFSEGLEEVFSTSKFQHV